MVRGGGKYGEHRLAGTFGFRVYGEGVGETRRSEAKPCCSLETDVRLDEPYLGIRRQGTGCDIISV